MTEFRIRDGDRTLLFNGELLSSSSTDDGRAQRWTDVSIYRHEDGRYVLSKVGRSSVYHTPGSSCASGTPTPAIDLLTHADDLTACRRCDPLDLDLQLTSVILEDDRPTAHVARDADSLIRFAHMQDDNGVRFMPNVVRQALRQAAGKDPAIEAAFLVERI